MSSPPHQPPDHFVFRVKGGLIQLPVRLLQHLVVVGVLASPTFLVSVAQSFGNRLAGIPKQLQL